MVDTVNEKPKMARSYRTSIIDDNAVISLNLKWMFQIIALCAMLVYGYYNILNRIEKLEKGFENSNKQIEELVRKHIQEEKIKYERLEKELQWYQKELNLNPLSWKKKRGKK